MVEMSICLHAVYFFFNDTATTEIYTLSLHDALPISASSSPCCSSCCSSSPEEGAPQPVISMPAKKKAISAAADRKSTRLNSSHANISYAVFCLKKKKLQNDIYPSYRWPRSSYHWSFS